MYNQLTLAQRYIISSMRQNGFSIHIYLLSVIAFYRECYMDLSDSKITIMKIHYVIAEKIGNTVAGTNFVKGDYIPTIVEYFAKTSKGFVNLSRDQVIKLIAKAGVTNVQRITPRMLSLLRGMTIK